jgi:hypothetical protein
MASSYGFGALFRLWLTTNCYLLIFQISALLTPQGCLTIAQSLQRINREIGHLDKTSP